MLLQRLLRDAMSQIKGSRIVFLICVFVFSIKRCHTGICKNITHRCHSRWADKHSLWSNLQREVNPKVSFFQKIFSCQKINGSEGPIHFMYWRSGHSTITEEIENYKEEILLLTSSHELKEMYLVASTLC